MVMRDLTRHDENGWWRSISGHSPPPKSWHNEPRPLQERQDRVDPTRDQIEHGRKLSEAPRVEFKDMATATECKLQVEVMAVGKHDSEMLGLKSRMWMMMELEEFAASLECFWLRWRRLQSGGWPCGHWKTLQAFSEEADDLMSSPWPTQHPSQLHHPTIETGSKLMMTNTAPPSSSTDETAAKLMMEVDHLFSQCPGLNAFLGTPPDPGRVLPHLAILKEIEQREGPINREEPGMLAAWKEILEGYWGLITTPLATYALGRTLLILCEDGIYQVDEMNDHVRYWGGDEEGLEVNPWIFVNRDGESDSE
ncbi:hypothetical protein BJ508DRAFT_325539 [Ascobolus immersus RN42]|uniref:Uncharacterized protein n=1 Tax=Ascobolus immersus RN42 TaxID=1160509 RepID=A0A3N4I9X0_ASCIM|nr:hypothetical protein BJ508DRAFT_325539 [Ascobolus immersus RN42]